MASIYFSFKESEAEKYHRGADKEKRKEKVRRLKGKDSEKENKLSIGNNKDEHDYQRDDNQGRDKERHAKIVEELHKHSEEREMLALSPHRR